MSNKKLLLIATRLFWPPDSGRKVSLYHYCRGLHEVCGYDVYVYAFPEKGQQYQPEKKPTFIADVRIAKPIGKGTKIWNLFSKSLLSPLWPLQCALYYSRENENAIRAYVQEIQPDAVMTDMVRTAPYYPAYGDIPGLKILDMDDMLSKRYQRQKDAKEVSGSVAGKYSEQMVPFFSRLVEKSHIKKMVLAYEMKKMQASEVYYAKLFDKVILVSQTETETLKAMVGENKVYTVTMGVDYETMSAPMEVTKIPGTVSFMGDLGVAANVDSLKLLAERILPQTKEVKEVRVIGNCPESVKKQYEGNPKIHILGRVEDIREAVEQTEVFIAPIAYGSGIKTKVLETMAMGMPVVTNRLGIEGLKVENEVQCLVSDEASGMAEAIDRLLTDAKLRETVAENGQKYVKENCRWEAIFPGFTEMGL